MGQPAARITDMHVCPMITGVVPHVGGPITLGSPNVIVGSMPQARISDVVTCVGPPDMIVLGSFTVLVNNMPAARMGDATAHGGNIVVGFPTVLIGDAGGGGGGGGPSSIASLVLDMIEDIVDPDVTTGLGTDVDEILNKSPSLKAKMKALLDDGWTIDAAPGNPVECDKEAKIIRIDTDESANEQVQSLAHEAGHAAYQTDPEVPMAGKTKQEYVDANLMNDLKDEGEATLSNIEARNEILENGGPDIGIAGNTDNHPAYQESYDNYQESGDRDAAREEIGTIFADGEEAGDTGKSYRDYYSEWYEENYDDAHPEP
jgi:type VI secretion system secreted protein VgrG